MKNLEKKSKQVQKLIKDVVEERIDIPNNTIIFLDSISFIEIFTKKRIELIQTIETHHPQSVQKLANITQRKKQAVNRDLKILKKHEIITLEKKGRTAKPHVAKKFMVFDTTQQRIKHPNKPPLKSPQKEIFNYPNGNYPQILRQN